MSVVDVLVQEGVYIDYAETLLTSKEGSCLESPEQLLTNRISKKLLNLPTVPGSALKFEHFDCEEPLPDLGDSLVEPTSDDSMATGGCGGLDGHVTPPELLIGQKNSSDYPISTGPNNTQLSPWQKLQQFYDTLL